jgi:hypothetical protein
MNAVDANVYVYALDADEPVKHISTLVRSPFSFQPVALG